MNILCFCNKDEYSFPERTEVAMHSNNIDVQLFQNILDIIEKIKVDLLDNISPNVLMKTEKVLFYLDEK